VEQSLEVEAAEPGSRGTGEGGVDNDKGARTVDEIGRLHGERSP
jgi:hypothetical protein